MGFNRDWRDSIERLPVKRWRGINGTEREGMKDSKGNAKTNLGVVQSMDPVPLGAQRRQVLESRITPIYRRWVVDSLPKQRISACRTSPRLFIIRKKGGYHFVGIVLAKEGAIHRINKETEVRAARHRNRLLRFDSKHLIPFLTKWLLEVSSEGKTKGKKKRIKRQFLVVWNRSSRTHLVSHKRSRIEYIQNQPNDLMDPV